MAKEYRKYECGCEDTHDAELWSSTSVNHCAEHSWRDGELRPSDENPAECEGIRYQVVYSKPAYIYTPRTQLGFLIIIGVFACPTTRHMNATLDFSHYHTFDNY